MKIVLINTPFLYLDKEDLRHSQCLGLRYISAYLKENGFSDITFIDALEEGFSTITPYFGGYVRGLSVPQILNRIPVDAELVGISVPFSQLAGLGHDIAAGISERFPRAIVVMGGVYPSTSPARALTSSAHLIVVGEGEEAFLQLARGVSPAQIQGVYGASPNDAKLPAYQQSEPIAHLDSIPFPDYSLANMSHYFLRGQRAKQRWDRTATIITSRGCPFNCEFCSIHPIVGYKWRGRSPENVLAELEVLSTEFGITRFEIEDDNFTFDKERTVAILEGMIRLNEIGRRLEWRVPNGIRIDTVDAEIIQLFKRANCKQVILALEHGSPPMLQLMNKKLSLSKAYEVINGFIQVGLENIGIFLMVGYPGETVAYFEDNLAYLKTLKQLGGNLTPITCIAQPYPGTQLLARCLAAGYLPQNVLDDFFSCQKIWHSARAVIIEGAGIGADEVLQREERIRQLFIS